MTTAVPLRRAKATLEVHGEDDQPIIIPEGQWYVTPKARPQRMMRNSLSGEARQVYACLELATMGWRQELAVKMENGEPVPLTASDLVEQTGLSPERVRRALVELEEQGLGCRRSTDDGPLRKGRVEIYSFAVPRPAQKPKYPPRAGGIFEPDDVELKPLQTFLRRWKITPDEGIAPARDGLKSLAEDIAQWEKTGNALRARAETLCAPSRLNKEERKERNGKEYLESHPPATVRAEVPVLASEAPLVSEAHVRKATSSSSLLIAHDDDAHSSDPEFGAAVTAAFVKGNRPAPTEGQLRDLRKAIPDDPVARGMFIPYLAEKMPRLQHPGSLPSIAQEFMGAWPVLKAEAESAAEVGAAAQARRSEIERQGIAEAELDQRAAGVWEQLSIAEKKIRLNAAVQLLQPEPRWKHLTEQQRKQEMERYARAKLKIELQQGVANA